MLACAAVFSAVLSWSAADVQASGVAAPAAGGWETVTSATVRSAHLNPATLTLRKNGGWQVDLGGVIAQAGYQRIRHAKYQHADGFNFALPLQAADIDPTKTGAAEAVTGNTRLPTGGIALAMPFGDKVMAGLSVTPEYAAVLKMPEDGPQRWQLRETLIVVAQASIGASVRIGDWLHLGAAVDLAFGQLSLRQVMDLAATDMLGDAFADPPINQPNNFGSEAPSGVRELDVLSRPANLNAASAFGVGFKVGAIAQPNDNLRIALAWQQGIDLTFVGDFYLDMDHPFFTTDLASQGLQYPRRVQGEAYVPFPTPSVMRAGLMWRVGSFTQHIQASWLWWSVIRSLDVTAKAPGLAQPDLGLGDVTKLSIKRDWQDTIEVETLSALELGDAWRVGLKLGYHSPVSPDPTMDMLALDGQRVVAGLSGRWQATETLAITAHATGYRIIERTVVASEHDRGNGVYNLAILVLGAGLQQSF